MLRAGVRLPALVGWTLLCVLALLLLARRVAGRSTAAPRARLLRRWAGGMLALLGVRVARRGRTPDGGCCLASNHLGYLDILVLASQVEAVFVAKHDIAAWPVLGGLTRAFGTVFLDRARPRDLMRAFREIEIAQRHGVCVVIFPEGTSSGGDSVLPFRAGLFEAAARSGAPVATCALAYATPPGTPPPELAVCWWGGMTLAPHFLRLLLLPAIEARLAFSEGVIGPADRRALADAAQREVARLRAEIAPPKRLEAGG